MSEIPALWTWKTDESRWGGFANDIFFFHLQDPQSFPKKSNTIFANEKIIELEATV